MCVHHIGFSLEMAAPGAEKALLTLRAMRALKDHALSSTPGDDRPVRFYVTLWGMERKLRDLAVVVRFLDQVGGAHA